MLIAVLSGFILALCLSFFGRLLKGKLSFILSALPILLFLYSLSFVPRIAEGETVAFNYTWIPSYGINLDFHLDGLSLLFIYAANYRHRFTGVFIHFSLSQRPCVFGPVLCLSQHVYGFHVGFSTL